MDKAVVPGRTTRKASDDIVAFCAHALARLAEGHHEALDLEAHAFSDAGSLRLIANLKHLQQRFRQLEFALGQLANGRYAVPPFLQTDTDPLTARLRSAFDSHAHLVRQAQSLIEGDFTEVRYSRADDDLLGACLEKLLANFQYVNWRVQMVAGGDCSAKIAPLSERDQLGKALDELTRSLRDVTTVAEAVASGDLSRKVKMKGETDFLGRSINQMIDGLNRLNDQNTHQQWFKTTLNQLSDELRGELDLDTMLAMILRFLARNLDFQIGTFYIHDPEHDVLELRASHAFRRRQAHVLRIRPGEGLIGQTALESDPAVYADLPADYLSLGSSLGETAVSAVLITPVRLNGAIKGVFELGSNRPITDRQIEFVQACQENIAIAINSAQVHRKLEQLLQETERQRNELEAQTATLRHNEEELRVQQEQLAQTNEELRVKTEQTELANEELRVKTAQTEQANEELRVKSAELEELNRRLEEKSHHLIEKQDDLERHNRELTRARDELEIKAKQLAESSRYKTEFLANMSHELRTPLNSLMILAKMLADNGDGNLNEDQIESASVILNSGKDLMTLINEILDLSKVEAGKMDIYRDPVSLSQLIDTLNHQFMPMATEKGIVYESRVEQDVPAGFLGDIQRIKQVLRNLIGNAIKFTLQGSVTLLVRCVPARASRLAREAIEFEIHDTGIGIPSDKLDFIFEAFQQIDGSTSREFGGTGLGLTICREMTKLLQGDIRVESEPDRGSRFFLQLPLERLDNDAAPDIVAPSSSAPRSAEVLEFSTRSALLMSDLAPEPTQHSLKDDRDALATGDRAILIVEDDKDFCRSLMSLAHRNGYKCLTALDGQTAIELAKRWQPHGILLDLELPDIDGQKVLHYLKDNVSTRHIPVHILSARDASRNEELSAAVGYLTKPLSEADVLAAFARLENIHCGKLKRLLLVEDDAANAHAITHLLGDPSLEIESVAHGAEAYERLLAKPYDCMVLDLSLPDSDGLGLLRRIEQEGRIKLPAVIVYTGRDLNREEHAELARHAKAIVLKGQNSPERLLDEVALFLHRVDDDPPQANVRTLHASERVLAGKSVLLVDDDMRNIFAMTKVLKANGLLVDIAENGQVAIDKVTARPDYDLILMDIMMPVMDGFEAIDRIRRMDRARKIPIIALTAKAMPEDRKKCLDAGANDYISKPVDTSILISMLQVWLSQSRPAPAAADGHA